jgi:hypothetical protein
MSRKKNLFDSPEIKLEGIEKFILDLNDKVENNKEIINNHLVIFNETLECLAKDKSEIQKLKKKTNLLFNISIGLSSFVFILFLYILIFM